MKSLGAVLVLVAGCATWAGRDPYPLLPKHLADGCSTPEACDPLTARARERVALCDKEGLTCPDAREDLTTAEQLSQAAEARMLARRKLQEDAERKQREDAERERAEDKERAQKAREEAEQAHVERCAREREAIAEYQAKEEERRAHLAEEKRLDEAAEKWVHDRCKTIREPVYDTKVYVDKGGFVKAGRAIVDYEDKTVCPASTPEDVVRRAHLEKRGTSWVRDPPDSIPSVSRNQAAGQTARVVDRTPVLSEDCGGPKKPKADDQPRTRSFVVP